MLRTPAILQAFGFRAFALHPHTCCLRNRIQSLTHASRVTILSAFSIHCATYCISYGLLRASHSRNPTGIRVFAVFHTASRSYLLPSKSHPVSFTRFARDDPVCVFEELIQYKSLLFLCIPLPSAVLSGIFYFSSSPEDSRSCLLLFPAWPCGLSPESSLRSIFSR